MSRPMTAARALVLGGTGFLGAQVATALALSGVEAATFARSPVQETGTPAPARRHLGDVADAGALGAALEHVTHVVHAVGNLTPAAAERDPAGAVAGSIAGVLPLLALLRSHPGVRLTYISSGGAAYGESTGAPSREDHRCDPISAYGRAKLATERCVLAYADSHGLPVRIVRVANAYGRGQRVVGGQGLVAALLAAVESGAPVPVFGDLRIVRDYVHVQDVASAVAAVALSAAPPTIVNVGSGVGHSIGEVLDTVQEVTGCRPSIRPVAHRAFDVRRNVLDVAVLRNMTAWDPRTLAAGVHDTWAGLGLDRRHLSGRSA
jgi:UDP-glucose 4-epimerase